MLHLVVSHNSSHSCTEHSFTIKSSLIIVALLFNSLILIDWSIPILSETKDGTTVVGISNALIENFLGFSLM